MTTLRFRADVQALGSVLGVRIEQQVHPYCCRGVIPTEQVVDSLLLGRHTQGKCWVLEMKNALSKDECLLTGSKANISTAHLSIMA